jgi:hypothetical protein
MWTTRPLVVSLWQAAMTAVCASLASTQGTAERWVVIRGEVLVLGTFCWYALVPVGTSVHVEADKSFSVNRLAHSCWLVHVQCYARQCHACVAARALARNAVGNKLVAYVLLVHMSATNAHLARICTDLSIVPV